MKAHGLLPRSIYEEQNLSEDRELTRFINSVEEMCGAERTLAAMQIWLEEADLADIPPISFSRDWRAVSIAASARVFGLKDDSHRLPGLLPVVSLYTDVSPTLMPHRVAPSAVARSMHGGRAL